MDAKYPLQELEEFTVATAPDATKFKNHVIAISNGNAGAACIAVSDGANWKVIAFGATAAAA